MENAEQTLPSTEIVPYERILQIVSSEFSVEEGFLEFNLPSFYIRSNPNLKQAFLRLYVQLDSMKLVPVLRKREGRYLLQVVPKPIARPSKPWVNIVLFAITVGTTLISGYVLSAGWPEFMPDPWLGAAMFSAAIMFILGAHEMGHKLMASRHRIEATYPYFIPGLPPLGTFGAVIQEKSLPPNEDSLFDLGVSGPLIGFAATIAVTIIGVQLSLLLAESQLPPDAGVAPFIDFFGVPLPLLFGAILTVFPPPGSGSVVWLHPLVQAGYIGMIVTMLNLMPVGQLDGGHIAHVLFGERGRMILAVVGIALMVVTGYYFMAILAFLIARVRHPDPLDGVSGLSRGRKLAAFLVVMVFLLCLAPLSLF